MRRYPSLACFMLSFGRVFLLSFLFILAEFLNYLEQSRVKHNKIRTRTIYNIYCILLSGQYSSCQLFMKFISTCIYYSFMCMFTVIFVAKVDLMRLAAAVVLYHASPLLYLTVLLLY